MRLKRRPDAGAVEPWLEWQKRSLAKARDTIYDNGACIVRHFLDSRENWAELIARFGATPVKLQHLLKAVCLWRCSDWQTDQNWYNELNWSPGLLA